MAPPLRARPAPIDRFTDASASAITSGFSAAMALGPQPKAGPSEFSAASSTEGVEWLRDLQSVSGFGGTGTPADDDDDDDDDESEGEGSNAAAAAAAAGSKRKGAKRRTLGGGGSGNNKKKSSSSGGGGGGGEEEDQAAARKAQNRIAQREFRQRKQQYIRALEARVELLSSDHDTQVDRLRYALRGLLAENNQLRAFVNNLASFIGQAGLGGPLQRAGMSREELQSIIFGSSEKTMTESWQNWPGAKECEALRNIRMESNLPPEGLPESLPPNAATTAANKARAAESAAAASSAAAAKDDDSGSPGSNKRKSSIDEGPKKRGRKPKQAQALSSSSPSTTDQTRSLPSASSPAEQNQGEQPQRQQQQQQQHLQQQQLLQQQQQMVAFMQQQQQQAPPEQPYMQVLAQQLVRDPQVFSQYFAAGPDSLNLTNANGALASASPSLDGPAGQDSSALLASLFGVQPMMPFSNGSPPFTTTPAKTTTRQGEPDEVRRLRALGLRVLASRKEKRKERGEPNEEAAAKADESALDRQQQIVMQLAYHMANYRRQPSYELPSMLKPSEIQQTRPHDPLLDIMPFVGLRQNCIAHQDRLDIDEMITVLLDNVQVHEGDAMDLAAWEIEPGFLFAYPSLIDSQTLESCNRWRRSRGQRDLTFECLTMGRPSDA
ncbi:hypothetical protein FA10DRAFT_269009 [Acaromyces ingoldii]|uniref:BZIP domain-containing protein n=1 Tax=Acaromyces ingoldii TaxID=215250 RepID=A0A316YIZ8_9BASI|nr:hypothetical protein FA10DRAFT_269009 [Acaromyces ingoldii]PWN87695.1 hypothetical protein FA10DRAFT_269009 [Acaromyces ingoldii]